MMVDVLHHTIDPTVLLREAARVTREYVVLKDHCLEGPFAGVTLKFMDRVGNSRHGVPLPYNYWRRTRWQAAFSELGLEVDRWSQRLGLYPPPAGWFFDRRLQFLARLRVGDANSQP